MMKVAGIDCYAEIDGNPIEFRGLFDEQARTEVDGGQEVLVNETGLIVKRSIANDLTVNTAIKIYVEPGENPLWYRVRDKQSIEDGSLVQLYLVLRTDVSQPDPYEEAEDDWENFL